jgi:hypothetical protein
VFLPRIASLILLACAACSGGDDSSALNPAVPPPVPGSGALTLLATDDPFLYEIVAAAEFTVDDISLHADPDAEDGGFVNLFVGPPRTIDLFALRNGVTAELAHSDLRPGTYRQIRVHVADAELRLVNGNVYSTALGNLFLGNQDEHGFRVFVDPPIVIEEGVTSAFLLDFDLTRTFRPNPADDPERASSYGFLPVIRATNVRTDGAVRGAVVRPGAPVPTPVQNATVYVLPEGVFDLGQSVAITASTFEGHYTQLGLTTGVYDLRAVQGALSGEVLGVTVVAGTTTTVDIPMH